MLTHFLNREKFSFCKHKEHNTKIVLGIFKLKYAYHRPKNRKNTINFVSASESFHEKFNSMRISPQFTLLIYAVKQIKPGVSKANSKIVELLFRKSNEATNS